MPTMRQRAYAKWVADQKKAKQKKAVKKVKKGKKGKGKK